MAARRWTEQYAQRLIELIAKGWSSGQIARELGFSSGRIRQYKRRLRLLSDSMRGKVPKLPEPRKPPLTPTNYLPGTSEKVEVMRKRYMSGEFIHHPEDVKGKHQCN